MDFIKQTPSEIDVKKQYLNLDLAMNIFKKMCLVREFERQVKKYYDTNEIKCPVYLSTGQESISATISMFFKPDLIFSQHRGHSAYICFGGNIPKLIDELLGRDSGCNKGKGGSTCIQDLDIGMIGHHGLIGENVPLAVGAALGDLNKKVLCLFGDGAAEEDYVFTAMAFASTHKLPVLFICEDNDLAILTKKQDRRNWELASAIKSIGMPSVDIPDDPELIADCVEKLKDNLPAFINCRTCRHLWHAGTGQDNIPEIDRLKELRENLLKKGASEDILKEIEDKTKFEEEELWEKHLVRQ
jgi:TPP-dependent pyruvate/acetoin dehydrogenase alpha subunit